MPVVIPRLIPGHTIALQDAMIIATDAGDSLVTNIAAGLSGCYVDAGATQTMAGFLASTAAQIMETLQDWPLFKTPPRYIMIDIETPVRPQEWGLQTAAYFTALSLRVKTAKTAFPGSIVGLYGTPFPPSEANGALYGESEAKGYELAAATGVDFTCPVCRSPWVEADPGFGTLPAYVQYGLAAATAMGLPVVPIMAFYSVNGSSAGNGRPFSADVLRVTLAQIYKYSSVQAVAIWGADETQVGPAILTDVGFDLDDETERSIKHYWSAVCYPRWI